MFPSLPQFLSSSRNDSIIPFILEVPFPPGGDAFPLFQKLASRLPFTFFFDSFNARPLGRYSYFPLSAPRKRWVAKSRAEFAGQWKKLRSEIAGTSTDFEQTVPVLSVSSTGHLQVRGKSFEPPPFLGGAVVFLSYDAGRAFEPGWKSQPPADPLRFPWMEAGIYDDLFCLDHQARRAYIISRVHFRTRPDTPSPANKAALTQIYRKKESELRERLRRITGGGDAPDLKRSAQSLPKTGNDLNDRSGVGDAPCEAGAQEWFLKSVSKLKEYIAAGDIYQANLSRRISVPYNRSGQDYFARLREINPSPYSCYGRFGFGELASCSPELLLKKRGRLLETRPIAGTRPRGRDAASDRKLQGDLLLNAKERAEHVMLLDLERNDLGRVSVAGSVRVKEKMIVEKYSHVMHIVSAIQGRMKYNQDVFKAIEAVFPGGTITGCPKVRCMNILDELEPVRRGPFYGSLGWIGYGGDCEMNLLIRTALLPKTGKNKNGVEKKTNRILIQAGSGIVADSAAPREFEESGFKARALLAAAKS